MQMAPPAGVEYHEHGNYQIGCYRIRENPKWLARLSCVIFMWS